MLLVKAIPFLAARTNRFVSGMSTIALKQQDTWLNDFASVALKKVTLALMQLSRIKCRILYAIGAPASSQLLPCKSGILITCPS